MVIIQYYMLISNYIIFHLLHTPRTNCLCLVPVTSPLHFCLLLFCESFTCGKSCRNHADSADFPEEKKSPFFSYF